MIGYRKKYQKTENIISNFISYSLYSLLKKLNSGNRKELEVLVPFSSCHGYHIYKNFELQTIVLRSLILVLCFELLKYMF